MDSRVLLNKEHVLSLQRLYTYVHTEYCFDQMTNYNACLVSLHSMTRQSWREWTPLVLDSDAIYCNIIFANRIASTFITFLYEVNKMCKHLHGDWSQTHQHKTDRLTPDSRLSPNAASSRLRHRCHNSLVWISCNQSRHRQNLISIFFLTARTAHSYSQTWRTLSIILGVDRLLVNQIMHWPRDAIGMD
jgi:hypothetical protein